VTRFHMEHRDDPSYSLQDNLPFAAPEPIISLKEWNPTIWESLYYVALDMSICAILVYLHLAFVLGVVGMILTVLDGIHNLFQLLDEAHLGEAGNPRLLPPLGHNDEDDEGDDSSVEE
jgi:hypothetical protein